MRIANSALTLESQHTSMLRTEERQKLEVWVGDRSRSAAPAAAPVAAAATTQLSAASADSQAEQGAGTTTDWRILLIKAFVEWLTGKTISLYDGAPLQGNAAGCAPATGAATAPPATANASSAPPSAGYGIRYDYHASTEEVEQTDFSAQGEVTTADGRHIDLSLQVEMARAYLQQTDVSVRAGDAVRKDPLVLNLGGAATQLSTQHMSFDLNGDGQKESVALLAGGSAYLALDANQNGTIDSGRELFGPATGAGFAELAKYDSDGNGWIDENDPIFKQLRLWKPDAAGAGSLATLKEANVGALFLGSQATSFQLRGAQNEDLGAVRSTGLYLSESGLAGSIQQIDLTV
jgi:hypothetical protein